MIRLSNRGSETLNFFLMPASADDHFLIGQAAQFFLFFRIDRFSRLASIFFFCLSDTRLQPQVPQQIDWRIARYSHQIINRTARVMPDMMRKVSMLMCMFST
ncbi:MAG: hypothetical protein ACJAR1_000593 [Rubritalea sp.]|jgi:hypothetical protein